MIPEALLTFIASAAGSLIAAYFGAMFAVKQNRQVKVFDQRVEWYVSILNSMTDIITYIGIMTQSEKRGFREFEDHLSMAKKVHDMKKMDNQRDLYASKDARLALHNMWSKLDPLAEKMASREVDEDGISVSTKAAIESVHHLEDAKEVLSSDLRKYMGIKD